MLCRKAAIISSFYSHLEQILIGQKGRLLKVLIELLHVLVQSCPQFHTCCALAPTRARYPSTLLLSELERGGLEPIGSGRWKFERLFGNRGAFFTVKIVTGRRCAGHAFVRKYGGVCQCEGFDAACSSLCLPILFISTC